MCNNLDTGNYVIIINIYSSALDKVRIYCIVMEFYAIYLPLLIFVFQGIYLMCMMHR